MVKRKVGEKGAIMLEGGIKKDAGMRESDNEFGVCDECGEYTEELILISGTWICKQCSRMF